MKTKVAAIVSTNKLDKVLPLFNLIIGAASMDMEVVVFFTFLGVELLRKNKEMVQSAELSKFLENPKVLSLDEMIAHCKELGVKFICCTMSMEVLGIKKDDIVPEADTLAGVAAFIAEAQDAKVHWFV